MEQRCQYCNTRLGDPYEIGRPRWNQVCDGILTLGPDPFNEEIYGDSTELWMCFGARDQSAMEI